MDANGDEEPLPTGCAGVEMGLVLTTAELGSGSDHPLLSLLLLRLHETPDSQ
jgi:hypothetical protein